MTLALDDDTELLLNAYMDGELDAASSLAFDRRLAAEPELAAARDRLIALRRLLADMPRDEASVSLLAAVAAIAAPPRTPSWRLDRQFRLSADTWRPALAASVVGALLGASAMGIALPHRAASPVVTEAVSDHLRAVMAPQPFDVASSDQHTVKPWFTGRLTFAPRVFDLSGAGFTLIGGRVDVLGGRPAATLVFRSGKHVISLIAQPAEPSEEPSDGKRDNGFSVRDWTTAGVHYWAVSDIARDEIDAFEDAVKKRLASD